jgi:hypothetical protein
MVHAVADYLPGIKQGQWAEYRPLYSYCEGSGFMESSCGTAYGGNVIGRTRYVIFEVVSTFGPTVVLKFTTVYTDGTLSQGGASFDLTTGASNATNPLTLYGLWQDFFVLAGGLQAPDMFWNKPAATSLRFWTLNVSRAQTVLGASRRVNFFNNTSSHSIIDTPITISSSIGFAFDQDSGVPIELSFSEHSNSLSTSYHSAFAWGIVDNNIWLNSISPNFATPDFTLSQRGRLWFTTGSSGSTTIMIEAQNGFNSTINLEVVGPSQLSCSISKTSLVGRGNATLTCTGQEGGFAVTVIATSRSTSHSALVLADVRAPPAPNLLANNLILVLILAGILVVVVGVLTTYFLLRKKRAKPTAGLMSTALHTTMSKSDS